jgi:hypothetical protein
MRVTIGRNGGKLPFSIYHDVYSATHAFGEGEFHQLYALIKIKSRGVSAQGNRMVDAAPELIEVKIARLGEFERELREFLQEVADGKHDVELRARGITLPAGMSADAITTKSTSGQAAAAEQFVELAIKYAPLIVPIGQALWAWAWPKLRACFGCSRSQAWTLIVRSILLLIFVYTSARRSSCAPLCSARCGRTLQTRTRRR